MASWMIHLRVAEKLLAALPELSETEFIMGNIAPDSGVPNADWSAFSPPKTVSHFQGEKKDGISSIDIAAFVGKYFTPELRTGYDRRTDAFFLGYLCHLLTDRLWSPEIYLPALASIPDGMDQGTYTAAMKVDWYDLDFLYLRDHPDFRAFQIYRSAVGFKNTFMTEFSPEAFDDRRAYITDFYLQENHNLDREYPYLTKERADQFVEKAAAAVREAFARY